MISLSARKLGTKRSAVVSIKAYSQGRWKRSTSVWAISWIRVAASIHKNAIVMTSIRRPPVSATSSGEPNSSWNRIISPIPAGTSSGCILKERANLPESNATPARNIPQPGQGTPVTRRIGQPISNMISAPINAARARNTARCSSTVFQTLFKRLVPPRQTKEGAGPCPRLPNRYASVSLRADYRLSIRLRSLLSSRRSLSGSRSNFA